jgi:hypothetical protein
MSTSVGQAFVAMIESDLATVGGAPLVAFIQAEIAAKGNFALQAANLLQFQAGAPAMGIALGVELEQQVLQLALGKVQAAIAAKTSPSSTSTIYPTTS